jgi:hypothetical protein
MIRLRPRFQTLTLLVLLVGIVPLLAACGSTAEEDFVSWEPSDPDRSGSTPYPEEPEPHSTTESSGVVRAGTPEVLATPSPSMSNLTPNDLKRLQPNEIGWIPVMEYHVITTDPARESDPFVRTANHLRDDLQFLYENDFYVIPMRELVRNEITAPAGKHPVVLSFDDATSSQFRWISDAGGKRVIDPDSAMGVLEGFFAEHPDFGRGGFFAVLPFNCFADDTTSNTADDCTDKLTWMAANGYEIGLHTIDHQDLHDVSDAEFQRQVGENVIWVDERVQGAGNMSRVLVMPFGDYPDRHRHQEQRRMMREGFTYKGVDIKLEGALLVGANPTESPSSATFDPIFIARIQAFKESLDQWFPKFESGAISLYTSDGNPDVITLPTTIPADLEGQFDPDVIVKSGKKLVQYHPASGKVATFPHDAGKTARLTARSDRRVSTTVARGGDLPSKTHRECDGIQRGAGGLYVADNWGPQSAHDRTVCGSLCIDR